MFLLKTVLETKSWKEGVYVVQYHVWGFYQRFPSAFPILHIFIVEAGSRQAVQYMNKQVANYMLAGTRDDQHYPNFTPVFFVSHN